MDLGAARLLDGYMDGYMQQELPTATIVRYK